MPAFCQRSRHTLCSPLACLHHCARVPRGLPRCFFSFFGGEVEAAPEAVEESAPPPPVARREPPAAAITYAAAADNDAGGSGGGETLVKRAFLARHEKQVSALAFSNTDATMVASGSYDNKVRPMLVLLVLEALVVMPLLLLLLQQQQQPHHIVARFAMLLTPHAAHTPTKRASSLSKQSRLHYHAGIVAHKRLMFDS